MLYNITIQQTSEYNKKKQTQGYREQTSGYQWGVEGQYKRGVIGGTKLQAVRWAQAGIAQHGIYSQYFAITVNGK